MRCPDDGRCHHDCKEYCFRVQRCGPLSGVYPGDAWPSKVLRSNGIREEGTMPLSGGPLWFDMVPELVKRAEEARTSKPFGLVPNRWGWTPKGVLRWIRNGWSWTLSTWGIEVMRPVYARRRKLGPFVWFAGFYIKETNG